MPQDFARSRKPASRRKQAPARRQPAPAKTAGWIWFFSGLMTGLVASLLIYLFTLPPEPGSPASASAVTVPAGEAKAPKPRFDFYTMLPEQRIDLPTEPAAVESAAKPTSKREAYLLQAGSFRQKEDADRRRAELLLLGLAPRIEEASGDNGRWFRVFLGPFESHAQMKSAQSLTASGDIDTLLLKRARP